MNAGRAWPGPYGQTVRRSNRPPISKQRRHYLEQASLPERPAQHNEGRQTTPLPASKAAHIVREQHCRDGGEMRDDRAFAVRYDEEARRATSCRLERRRDSSYHDNGEVGPLPQRIGQVGPLVGISGNDEGYQRAGKRLLRTST